jgi:hypothetical protein
MARAVTFALIENHLTDLRQAAAKHPLTRRWRMMAALALIGILT